MPILDPDVVKSRSEVKLREVFGSLEFLKEIFNVWDRGLVADGASVFI